MRPLVPIDVIDLIDIIGLIGQVPGKAALHRWVDVRTQRWAPQPQQDGISLYFYRSHAGDGPKMSGAVLIDREPGSGPV